MKRYVVVIRGTESGEMTPLTFLSFRHRRKAETWVRNAPAGWLTKYEVMDTGPWWRRRQARGKANPA